MGKFKSIRVYYALPLLIFLYAFFLGCGSSSDSSTSTGTSNSTNNSSTPPLGYHTYSEPGSDLVLKIPGELTVSDTDIKEIYQDADLVAHCHTTDGSPIDIVLAQTCIYYDMIYLFPQYFPLSLDNIADTERYVEYIEASDPYTFYFSAEEFASVESYIEGERAVIGLMLDFHEQTVTDETPLTIKQVVPFTRAWVDGFQEGDNIIRINGIVLEGKSFETVETLFPTTEEEAVTITVDRNGVEFTIDTASEENIGVLLEGDIIYLSLRTFTEITAEEIRRDYEELRSQSGGTANKLILDLRDNGGGSYNGALALTDYLIDNDNGSNPILYFFGPAFPLSAELLGSHNPSNIDGFNKSNFVVLVDDASASASEVLAAALKYYGTATLIGENTYGKGVGQSAVELIDGSGVFITSYHVRPPSMVSYHDIGITPDYYLRAEPLSFEEDPLLDAAIEYLNTGDITLVATKGKLRLRSESDLKATDPYKEKMLKKIIGEF